MATPRKPNDNAHMCHTHRLKPTSGPSETTLQLGLSPHEVSPNSLQSVLETPLNRWDCVLQQARINKHIKAKLWTNYCKSWGIESTVEIWYDIQFTIYTVSIYTPCIHQKTMYTLGRSPQHRPLETLFPALICACLWLICVLFIMNQGFVRFKDHKQAADKHNDSGMSLGSRSLEMFGEKLWLKLTKESWRILEHLTFVLDTMQPLLVGVSHALAKITALRIGLSLALAAHALEVVRAPSLGSFGRPSRQIPKHLERSSHLLQRPPSNGNHALRRNVEHLHRKSASHPPNPACCQSSPW